MNLITSGPEHVSSYGQDVSTITVGGAPSGSTVETAIHRFTISGRTQNYDGSFRLTSYGSYQNTTANGRNFTLRIRATTVGGAATSGTIMYSATHSPPAGSTERDVEMHWLFNNNASQTSQGSLGSSRVASLDTAGGVGSDIQANEDFFAHDHTSSVNTAADWDLVVTCQHSFASASISFFGNIAFLELIS